MKLKMLPLFIGLSANLISAGVLANQAVIFNQSHAPYKPITLTYEIAYKDPGKPVIYERRPSIKIMGNTAISFSLKGHKLAGIVPIAVDGHLLPSQQWFDKPNACALTTDKSHPNGALLLFRTRHQVSCRLRGGIFG